MTHSLALLYFVVITLAGHAVSSECNKPNEEKRCVPDCPPSKTCKNMDILISCLNTDRCEDKCICKEGFFRNAGGDCVTREECNKCNGQNLYYSCRVQPDETCASRMDGKTPSKDGQVPSKDGHTPNTDGQTGPSEKCKVECYCSPGTARDENNFCVPYDQCNKPCGEVETKDYCPTECDDSCPKGEEDATCPHALVCPPPKCKCRFNYRRRAENGTCIPTRECPALKCTKPVEEYHPCPPGCPNGSCDEATLTGECPWTLGGILRIGIVLECKPACRCKEGYHWKEDKICVPYLQCPGIKNRTTTEVRSTTA